MSPSNKHRSENLLTGGIFLLLGAFFLIFPILFAEKWRVNGILDYFESTALFRACIGSFFFCLITAAWVLFSQTGIRHLFKNNPWFNLWYFIYFLSILLLTNFALAGNSTYLSQLFLCLALLFLIRAFITGVVRNKHPRWGGFQTAGLSMIFATFLSFLILEAVFMEFSRSHRWSMSLAGRLWKEKHLEFNRFGFRDSEEKYKNLEGKKVIAALGDGLTSGLGISNTEHRYTEQLQNLLPGNHTVLNLGLQGSDTGDQLRTLLAFRHKPDILLLAWNMNDIDGAARRQGMDLPGPFIFRDKSLIGSFLIRNSYLFNYMYYLDPRPGEDAEYRQALIKAFSNRQVIQEHFREILGIQTACRKYNSEFLVILFPEMNDPEASGFALDPMVEKLEAAEIPYLDLRDQLRSMIPSDRLINKNDAHPSKMVHFISAVQVFQKMKEEGWISNKP